LVFCSLEERKKSFFVSVVFVSILLHFLLRTTRVTHIRRIVIVKLLRVVGVVFIKKDDAAYDDVPCEDASSTPRW
jgi:hypothetical protein